MSVSKKRRLEKTSNPEILLQWFEDENVDDESPAEDESDGEEDHVSVADDDTDSEQELSSIEEEEEEINVNDKPESYFLGKDGAMKWYKEKPKSNVRTRAHNIITQLPGPRGGGREAVSEVELFDLFFDNNVVRIITSTNIYIDFVRRNFDRERDARPTDEIEIRALIGLLYLIGSMRCSRKNVHQLWDNSKGNGLESCYLTMSEKRFRFLIRCLRFDDVRNRNARKVIDKFAPVRDIFELFVNNFEKSFSPSEYLTVDEQLLAFRGNCPFSQYIPSKPAKYGLKTFALVDAKTAYTVKLETYVGTQPEGPYRQSNAANDVVLRLVEPVYNSNRNITGDNWFSSIPLMENLKEKGLTYVGTLRKNKKEIPKDFQPEKTRKEKTSMFGFSENKTLVSYCPKKNKVVMAISSMHHDDAIDEETGNEKKPEMITFYNMTKVGVDLVDQLCQKNDVSRNTRRWPMVVFYNLLNISAINALCIYKAKNQNSKLRRTDFLGNLAWELTKPQIQRRYTLPHIPLEIRRRAKCLLGIENNNPNPTQRKGSRGRCYECGRARDRTTRRWCVKCDKWVCGDHLNDICVNCLKTMN